MANTHKADLLLILRDRYGDMHKLPFSQSLFVIGDEAARIYVRYSKVHSRGSAFFGLRDVDLKQLEAHNSFICFFTDSSSVPIFVPFADFEEILRGSKTANDGQYKVQLLTQNGINEIYIPHRGRFNVDGYVGFDGVSRSLAAGKVRPALSLSHSQVQTLLASIGAIKGFGVYVPPSDICNLDWSLCREVPLQDEIPRGFDEIEAVFSEIDVVWTGVGRNLVEGLFEVEHSTPIYSGLLRFNDVLLTNPNVSRYFIVSSDSRRELFSRQLFRPTFRRSGLSDCTSFLEYRNVFDWHMRLAQEKE